MDFILEAAVRAVKTLFATDISAESLSLQQTRKEFEGDITIVVFPLTKFSQKPPEQTGTVLGEFLVNEVEAIESFNVIKGFLNLSLKNSYWINVFYQTINQPDFGSFPSNGKKVMVEYSSPNTNKPLHLGHVRNNLLGYSVAEILKANGYEVIKANLVNDRGIHICKSMIAWEKFGNGETPESSGLKGDHLVGKYYVIFDKEYKKQIEALKNQGETEEQAKKNAPLIKEAQEMLQKWEQGDEHVIALWKKMNCWVYAGFEETYKKLGVDFDQYYYESNTYLSGKDIVEEGLEKGVFFKKADGSVWIDLTAEGLDEKLVLRADGTSVYITQDLGTAQLKYNQYHADKAINVVGNEQDYHFKVLFLILKKLGRSWAEGLYHLSYGMVDLPSGKMKSREGTVVDADDLIAEMEATAKGQTDILGKATDFPEEEKQNLYHIIGMGALKYFLLKVEPKKRLLFDPNESVDFQGHTGPFIQYTYARIRSVLNKGGFKSDTVFMPVKTVSAVEKDLIIQLEQFPAFLTEAAINYSPAVIANYVYELAKLYNKFYHEESILKAEEEMVKGFRLQLSYVAANSIKKAMQMLGIEVPERM
ncbi:arginine--tRNA ligase [Mucilaginibacter arboris]|uniref:Arginine--tRNA ligase n=1 Tax=Mucilaginibacter arboris TaxID=2682090 RepID=A0A7K1STK8_9SPHI|nr:arginine--tRNA ligase [Mucilaginibacter arboris]MVN20643.1 arginine--tRNA ligase [Mucilaginibacter arboris]